MILIDVGSESKQQIQVPFTDGVATIKLYFSSKFSCWFMSVSYNNNTVNNILIEYGVNLTYPFRHIFPFGIICVTNSLVRPVYIDSFSSEEASLIFYNPDENVNL